jgi:hypothetical protein
VLCSNSKKEVRQYGAQRPSLDVAFTCGSNIAPYRVMFIDFAQLKERFDLCKGQKRKFTAIYYDATTMQHHQSKQLT